MGRSLNGLVQSGHTMGIATQVGVCLHEFAHALLWDHVNSPNFGWCHSAGDTLAALIMDPGSQGSRPLRDLPLRRPHIDRRHDRGVAAGWAWGGTRDDRSTAASRSFRPRCSASTA